MQPTAAAKAKALAAAIATASQAEAQAAGQALEANRAKAAEAKAKALAAKAAKARKALAEAKALEAKAAEALGPIGQQAKAKALAELAAANDLPAEARKAARAKALEALEASYTPEAKALELAAAEALRANARAAEAYGLQALGQPETLARIAKAAKAEARPYIGIDHLEVMAKALARLARWIGRKPEAYRAIWLRTPQWIYGRARLYAKTEAGRIGGGGGGMPANDDLERQPGSPNYSLWMDGLGASLPRVKGRGKVELQLEELPDPATGWQPDIVELAGQLGASSYDLLALALAGIHTDMAVARGTDSAGKKLPITARPAYGSSHVQWQQVANDIGLITGRQPGSDTAKAMALRAADAARAEASIGGADARTDNRKLARAWQQQAEASISQAEARAKASLLAGQQRPASRAYGQAEARPLKPGQQASQQPDKARVCQACQQQPAEASQAKAEASRAYWAAIPAPRPGTVPMAAWPKAEAHKASKAAAAKAKAQWQQAEASRQQAAIQRAAEASQIEAREETYRQQLRAAKAARQAAAGLAPMGQAEAQRAARAAAANEAYWQQARQGQAGYRLAAEARS